MLSYWGKQLMLSATELKVKAYLCWTWNFAIRQVGIGVFSFEWKWENGNTENGLSVIIVMDSD